MKMKGTKKLLSLEATINFYSKDWIPYWIFMDICKKFFYDKSQLGSQRRKA